MKALWLNLVILSSVLLLSTGLPEDRNKDHHSLLNSDSSRENERSLQRRKPPMKVPGPKLKTDEDIPELTATEMTKQLADEGKGKKKGKKDVNLTKDEKLTQHLGPPDDDSKGRERGKKGKGNKDLVKKDEHPPNQEETQEERSRDPPKPETNTEAKQNEN